MTAEAKFSFGRKCISDLRITWLIALITISATVLVVLHERTGFQSSIGHTENQRLNEWLRVYSSFWRLSQLLFLFSIVLGASGLGTELADRTVRIWLLRPRPRFYFVMVFEGVGACAIFLLWVLFVFYLAGAYYFLGAPPQEFRNPAPLMANLYLAALTFFAVTRFLTFALQNSRIGTVAAIGLFITLEVAVRILPSSVANLLPRVRELVDTSLVVSLKPVSYPYALAISCCVICLLCYGLEAWRFQRQDIRV